VTDARSRRESLFWLTWIGFVVVVLSVYLLVAYFDHGLLDLKLTLICGAHLLGFIYFFYRLPRK
jgi:hypothetical protein